MTRPFVLLVRSSRFFDPVCFPLLPAFRASVPFGDKEDAARNSAIFLVAANIEDADHRNQRQKHDEP